LAADSDKPAGHRLCGQRLYPHLSNLSRYDGGGVKVRTLVGASLGSGPGRWRLFQVPLILLILHSHVLNNTLYLGMYLLVSLCITYVLCSIARFYMENNEMLAVKILIIEKFRADYCLVPRITLHGLIV
jgi:hypothetical protein